MPAIQQVLATKQLISKPLVEKFIIWAMLARHHTVRIGKCPSRYSSRCPVSAHRVSVSGVRIRIRSSKYPVSVSGIRIHPVSVSVGYGYQIRIPDTDP